MIKRLEIKNCLGIKELELEAGRVNLIRGTNESGKTSILEVIEKALRNSQRRARFVHDGADEGTLYVELDNGMAIDRRIKADGKSSVNLTKGGARLPKPESALRALAGEFSFNPVDFMACKDKEQTEILLSLLPMRLAAEQMEAWFGEVPPVNLEQHSIEVLTWLAEKYFYDRRTIANNEVKQCNAEIAALHEQLPDNYDGNKWRDVNIGALWAKAQDAVKVKANRDKAASIIESYDREVSNIDNIFKLKASDYQNDHDAIMATYDEDVAADKGQIDSEIADMELQIKQLQQAIKNRQNEKALLDQDADKFKESKERELAIRLESVETDKQRELETLAKRKKKAEDYLANQPDVDDKPLVLDARNAEQQKGFVPLYDNMRRLEDELESKKAAAAHLDQCVNLARRLPAQLLQNVELPVAGLGIDDNMQLTIDGLPIRNLSTSRQIRLALDIARATCGPLKLICIDRFESLDPINQEQFFEEIENDGYQYFITTTEAHKDESGIYHPGLHIATTGEVHGHASTH